MSGRPTASPRSAGLRAKEILGTASVSTTWQKQSICLKVQQRKVFLNQSMYLNEKYCGLMSCASRTLLTSGSSLPSFPINRFMMPLIPDSASSKLLMKKSRMSDIRLVKQKKQSASACSFQSRLKICIHN